MRLVLQLTGAAREYSIVELQGEVAPPEGCSLQQFDLGQLVVQEGGSAVLTLGRHRCKGKVVTLTKPLLVTAKGASKGSLEVKGIVRKKVVFTQRPMPLANK